MTSTFTKKLLAFVTISFFLFVGGIAHAQTGGTCPTGSDDQCTYNVQVCDPDTRTCIANPHDDLEAIGGVCDTDDDCRGNTTQCNPTTKLCEYDPNATAAPTSTTAGANTTTGNFVSLTQLPTFQGLTGQPNLTLFFNNLYKICIGIAITLALIQIILAGAMYMGGDSVTETRVARQKIGQAVLGLVLVLSPVIVFGIINPGILSLTIGGLPQLGTPSTNSATTNSLTTTPTGAPTCTTPIANNAVVTSANDQACCNLQTSRSCKVTLSIPPGGSILSSQSAICSCSS